MSSARYGYHIKQLRFLRPLGSARQYRISLREYLDNVNTIDRIRFAFLPPILV